MRMILAHIGLAPTLLYIGLVAVNVSPWMALPVALLTGVLYSYSSTRGSPPTPQRREPVFTLLQGRLVPYL